MIWWWKVKWCTTENTRKKLHKKRSPSSKCSNESRILSSFQALLMVLCIKMGVSKNRGTPKWIVYNRNPIKMDDLGGKPTIFGNIQIIFPLFWSKSSICSLVHCDRAACDLPWTCVSWRDKARNLCAIGSLRKQRIGCLFPKNMLE